jgi:dipeptidyl aminopeptidase/acylaminoacyl peptidase
METYSNELHVSNQTPPVFLAHAQNDSIVSAENSQMFHEALQAHKVHSQFLLLPSGDHGLDGYKGPMWDAWQEASLAWLARQKLISPAVEP